MLTCFCKLLQIRADNKYVTSVYRMSLKEELLKGYLLKCVPQLPEAEEKQVFKT